MTDTPKHNCNDSDDADEPLYASELVFQGPDGNDAGSATGLEGGEQEDPDEQNRDDAYGEGDEEPYAPGGFGMHVLQRDEVLGGGDGGGGAAYVGGEGDAHEEGFGHVGIGGEVAEDGLGKV